MKRLVHETISTANIPLALARFVSLRPDGGVVTAADHLLDLHAGLRVDGDLDGDSRGERTLGLLRKARPVEVRLLFCGYALDKTYLGGDRWNRTATVVFYQMYYLKYTYHILGTLSTLTDFPGEIGKELLRVLRLRCGAHAKGIP